MLHIFIAANREEIIRRCRAKVATRSVPPPTTAEIDHGVPLFLEQLVEVLRVGATSSPEIGRTAVQHGHDLLLQGFTVSQVVHDYGDVCQAITELAVELNIPISADEFRMLNECLDNAIAGAVTEYGRGRNQSMLGREALRGSERLGYLYGNRLASQRLPLAGARRRVARRGLGLAFSRWAVEANQGRLTARTRPHEGCVFAVDLPRLAAAGR